MSEALYLKAVGIVIERQKCSVLLVQRELNIGYASALRIIDKMESDGIVGPLENIPSLRRILVTKDGWIARNEADKESS